MLNNTNKNFEKNRLDLAYQRQLHYLNGTIVFATLGILTFLGTFIWNKENLLIGFIIVVVSIIISFHAHKKINKNLEKISNKIKNLDKLI